MPLDGANFVFSAQDILDDAIAACGLVPVEPRVLDQHKQEQVRRHPASWGYRHRHPIELAQVVALVTGVIAFFVLFSIGRFGPASVTGFVTIAAAVLPMLVPLKGPARWRERKAGDLAEVHPQIRDSALRLRRRLPEVGLYVGELYQDRVRLDPYLIAEYREARVVLGIWDGDRVIARA